MNTWKKNAPSFTSSEKRGLWVVSVLFCLCIAVPRYFAYRNVGSITVITSKEDSLVQLIRKESAIHHSNKGYNYGSKNSFSFEESAVQPVIVTQKFNPDTLSKEQWQQLGLSEKQSVALIHYKNAIHGFHTYEDFANAYTLDSTQVALWKPYLVFEAAKINQLNLNTATQEELIQLKGIGAFLAKQIVQYREELGGYVSIQQLQEVYKLSPEAYAAIKDYFKVDKTKINPIKINLIEAKELAKHPYLNYNQANSLVEFRKQHGNYQSPRDLLQSKLITEEDLVKLTPYLNFSTP